LQSAARQCSERPRSLPAATAARPSAHRNCEVPQKLDLLFGVPPGADRTLAGVDPLDDIKVVIEPKSNRSIKRDYDFALYCECNLVERNFTST
jgi:hypothetical protein